MRRKKVWLPWVPEEKIKLDKRIKPEDLKSIVFTTIGIHEDEPLWRILERKKKEDENCNRFWWGYTNVKIKPETVQKFVKEYKDKVWLVMAKTFKQQRLEWSGEGYKSFEPKSDYYKRGKGSGWAEYYNTEDKDEGKKKIPSKWIGVPNDGIALIAKNLRQVNFRINTALYKVWGREDNRYLSEYRRQADTHCATLTLRERHLSKEHPPQQREIYFVAELCEPYCVYLSEK